MVSWFMGYRAKHNPTLLTQHCRNLNFLTPAALEDAVVRFDVLRCDGFAKLSLQQECRQNA